jgi:hypothetical protein
LADMTASTMATWLFEQWSSLATITYRSNTVIVPLLDHRWEPELAPGMGDTVQIPSFSQNSTARSESTFGTGASITFDATTEAQVTLAVNTMAYKAFRIPLSMSVQRNPSYVTLLVDGIGKAVALKYDNDAAADNTNGIDAFSTTQGTDNVDVTFDDVLQCQVNLDNVNAPLEDRWLVVSPATMGSLYGIEVFRNQLYGASMGQLDAGKGPGYMGHVLTFDVYQSNNLEDGSAGKKNGAFQREAIATVGQKSLTLVEDVNIEDGPFNQYFGYIVYGLKEVKDNHGTELDGK